MIELTVLHYLESQLDVPVYMAMPEEMPGSFVLSEKTGSGEAVKAAMDTMADTENVFRARLNSDYNYTDTSVKRYRYQAVYDLTY